MTINIKGEELVLARERAIYLPQQNLLAVSDLHLGKPAHFRKAGLQIPSTLAQSDLERLSLIVDKYQPQTLLINGDMFHHEVNSEVDDFLKWKMQYPTLKFVLVKGNHDKLDELQYENLGIEIHDPSYCTSKFCFVHDAFKCPETDLYPISGHVHPGVSIIGGAKQRLRFPCFYFGAEYAIIPAFSFFTGLYTIKPKPNELVYAVTPNKVVKV